MSAQDELQPIIIKKIKKGGGGHHGGAWKVAYADFVTAMMAFFLLLWLLNVTTSEQQMGVADYFDPNPRISDGKSGAGGLMGGTTVSPVGAMTSTQTPLMQLKTDNATNPALRPGQNPGQSQQKGQGDAGKQKLDQAKQKKKIAEQNRFDKAKKKLEEAVKKNPALKKVAKNIRVDSTPEGLRIQVLDQEGEPMFATGSAQMFEKTRILMVEIAKTIGDTENQISVRGHTDGVPYGPGATYTNWELSADRANSTRRVLLNAGIPEERLNSVQGLADTDHLVPDNPADASNRRISIILLKEELTNPNYEQDIMDALEAEEAGAEAYPENQIDPDALPDPFQEPLFSPSEGEVEFP